MIDREEGLKNSRAFKELIKLIIRALNGILIIITCIGYFGKHLNPLDNKLTYILTLVLPFLFILNVLFLIIKIITKHKFSILFLIQIAIIIIIGNDFFGFNFKQKKAENNIKLMSYNVRGFNYYTKYANSIHEIAYNIKDNDPDIICMQEYMLFSDTLKSNFYNLIDDVYPYFNISSVTNFKVQNGLAIFSKYKILSSKEIIRDNKPYAQIVNLDVDGDTISIVNVHLQSTLLNYTINKSSDSGINYRRNYHNTASSIYDALLNSNKTRINQIDEIRSNIENRNNPIILCGDFNETNFTYGFQLLKNNLNDAFAKSGNGYFSTYNGLMNLLRIDHILYSDEFESINCYSKNLSHSDHNPVYMDFIIKN